MKQARPSVLGSSEEQGPLQEPRASAKASGEGATRFFVVTVPGEGGGQPRKLALRGRIQIEQPERLTDSVG